MHEIAPKWGVGDVRGLVARVAQLTDAEAAGVLRAAGAYWHRSGDRGERLTAAGLT